MADEAKDHQDHASVELSTCADDFIEFTLTNTGLQFANALRKTLLCDIPVFSITGATFIVNGGVVHDEQLLDRLSGVPLRFGKAGILPPSHSEQVKLLVDVTATEPSPKPRRVTSKDLVSHNPDVRVMHFASERERVLCEDADGGILLTVLTNGQRLQCECVATVGTAEGDSKFNTCCCCALETVVSLTVNQRIASQVGPEKCSDIATTCRAGIMKWDDDAGQLVILDARECLNYAEVVQVATRIAGEDLGKRLFVVRAENAYRVAVETVGSYAPHELVSQALSIMAGACDVPIARIAARLMTQWAAQRIRM